MAAVTLLRVVAAGLIGLVAWSGALWAIPLSIVVPCLVAIQPTRLSAGSAAFAYYAAASVPVIVVARSYWPSLGARGVLLWFTAAAILSLPSILCWAKRESRRPWATAVAVALNAVPPLCIVGWASPLVSAGVLFPNAAWLGVIGTLALPSLLLCESTRATAILTAALASLILNLQAKPLQVPKGWEAETTCIHRQRTTDDLAEFSVEERLQHAAVSSRRTFLVFPEGSVRRWTDASEAFWTAAIAGSGKTVLIGAGQPIAESRLYNNSIVIVGEHRTPAVYQRIPVPGGMWNPFRREGGFALNLFGPGTVDLDGQRAAILICYEQLLVWPMLRSAIERPTLLIAASNEAWTAPTRVPRVQHACVRAWARLFGLPVLSAINS
jgi:apolipoprotein N-acyltransferase